jgi:hypothetical protein
MSIRDLITTLDLMKILPIFLLVLNVLKCIFPSVIAAWNELDNNLCNVESLSLFKSHIRNTLYNTSLNQYS